MRRGKILAGAAAALIAGQPATAQASDLGCLIMGITLIPTAVLAIGGLTTMIGGSVAVAGGTTPNTADDWMISNWVMGSLNLVMGGVDLGIAFPSECLGQGIVSAIPFAIGIIDVGIAAGLVAKDNSRGASNDAAPGAPQSSSATSSPVATITFTF